MTNCRVVATKKLEASLVQSLASEGIETIEAEMISTKPTPGDSWSNEAPRAEALVVFTSKNAVEAVAASMKDHDISKWKVFCIEGNTSITVKELLAGASIAGTASNANLLARLIVNSLPPSEVFFFCGNLRRNELPSHLALNGFAVKEIVVYQTELSPVEIKGRIDAVMFFSPSAVRSFFLKNQLNSNTVCFSVGETTTQELKLYGSNTVITAGNPSAQCLAAEVEKWAHTLKSSN